MFKQICKRKHSPSHTFLNSGTGRAVKRNKKLKKVTKNDMETLDDFHEICYLYQEICSDRRAIPFWVPLGEMLVFLDGRKQQSLLYTGSTGGLSARMNKLRKEEKE